MILLHTSALVLLLIHAWLPAPAVTPELRDELRAIAEVPREKRMNVLRPGVVGATHESFPLFRCPRCGRSGVIDEDQFHGRVSIECPHEGCGYHETQDWSGTP